MDIISKYKNKFPIGCIVKHRCCNLMYEILDYRYTCGQVNHVGLLSEYDVVFKVLYFPEDKIGCIYTFCIDYLREFTLSSREYLEKIISDRNSLKQKNLSIEKYEQLCFDFEGVV